MPNNAKYELLIRPTQDNGLRQTTSICTLYGDEGKRELLDMAKDIGLSGQYLEETIKTTYQITIRNSRYQEIRNEIPKR